MSRRWVQALIRLNPSCRAAMGLVSRALDVPLSRGDRVILAVHMLHCPACRRARSQLAWLAAALRRQGRTTPAEATLPGLPPAARARVIERLREE